MTSTTSTAAADQPIEHRRFERRDDTRPRIPFRDHVKSFRMFDDGREIVIDRRVIAFATPHREQPDTGSVIGFRASGAKPVVVRAPFAEVKLFWLGPDAPAGNGKAA